MKCAELIQCISDQMKSDLFDEIRDGMYFSIMIDGATDSSVKENEELVIRYMKDGMAETRFLSVAEAQHCDADGYYL